jgi:glycosyltransferase involved in cell wall biosynthesis
MASGDRLDLVEGEDPPVVVPNLAERLAACHAPLYTSPVPRLLFITGTAADVPEGSGTYIGISVLREALKARGHRVEVLAPAPHRGPISFPYRLFFNLRARAAARKLLPAADLLVGFDLDGFLVQSRGVRRVAAIKGVLADELRFERGLARARLTIESLLEGVHVRRADRILATSEYSAARIAESYGVPAQRIAVVPEPIDLEHWRRAFDAVPGLPRRGKAILCVAHLYPRKDVATLLAAMLRLPHEAVLRVAGTGPELARLKRQARELGLGGRVEFLGHVAFDRLAGEYRRADVFCLPSRQEGFGIVFLEAMAAGLPIVAARAAAVPEVVPDGVCGILVPAASPDELAHALNRLLSSDEERRRMGEAGRRRAALYDMSLVATRFLEAVGLASPA